MAYAHRARREAAQGLEAAAQWLRSARPGYQLLVLDALRPQRIQEEIWAQVEGTPLEGYFAPPQRGSIHSFGMAVDVTLLAPNGQPVDMGTHFDEMNTRSHPALDADALRRCAVKEGMRPLRLAGAMKVAEGLTTVEEVLRSTPLTSLRELSFPAPDDPADVYTLKTDKGSGYIDQGTGKLLSWQAPGASVGTSRYSGDVRVM